VADEKSDSVADEKSKSVADEKSHANGNSQQRFHGLKWIWGQSDIHKICSVAEQTCERTVVGDPPFTVSLQK
jgi:hypothetical protein